MSHGRQRAEEDVYARHVAYHLPGEYADNLNAVMRVRAQRIRKLRAEGHDSYAIREILGLTYRQQHYALRWEARHAVQD